MPCDLNGHLSYAPLVSLANPDTMSQRLLMHKDSPLTDSFSVALSVSSAAFNLLASFELSQSRSTRRLHVVLNTEQSLWQLMTSFQTFANVTMQRYSYDTWL